MKAGQEEPVPFYCPRCKGLMYKPQGSPFFWHADNNHPRCTITNIADGTTGTEAQKRQGIHSLTQPEKPLS